MKTLFIALALLVFSRTGFGQGTVLFSNREPGYGIDAPIYDFSGNPCSGSAVLAQLYYAFVGSTFFTPAGEPLIFRTGSRAGYFDNTVDQNRMLFGVAAGANVQIQIRVWESAYGSTFEEARLSGRYDYSPTLIIATGGGGSPPSLPGVLYGLKSFQMRLTPEPSTIALGLIGAGALFFRRRK